MWVMHFLCLENSAGWTPWVTGIKLLKSAGEKKKKKAAEHTILWFFFFWKQPYTFMQIFFYWKIMKNPEEKYKYGDK